MAEGRAFASGAVDSGQTNDFKIGIRTSQLSCLMISIKGTVWRTSQQVYLLCRLEGRLAGFPIFMWQIEVRQLPSKLVIAL